MNITVTEPSPIRVTADDQPTNVNSAAGSIRVSADTFAIKGDKGDKGDAGPTGAPGNARSIAIAATLGGFPR